MAKLSTTRSRERLSYVGYPLGLSLILIALWQVAVPLFNVNRALLPTPLEVLEAISENFGLLLQHSWPTLYETLIGYVLASLIGVLAAILITTVPIAYKSVYPLLVGLLVVPKIAIAPLFVIWFGFGYTPKVIMVVLIAFFPVVVNMALGLNSVPHELHMLTRSVGTSRWRTFWKVSLPSATPSLFVGLKLAMALAIIGAIVAEFVQSSKGLGFLLLRANSTLDTPLFFAAIVMLTVLGVLVYEAVEVVERIVLRNRRAA